jgi:hypothetical protein
MNRPMPDFQRQRRFLFATFAVVAGAALLWAWGSPPGAIGGALGCGCLALGAAWVCDHPRRARLQPALIRSTGPLSRELWRHPRPHQVSRMWTGAPGSGVQAAELRSGRKAKRLFSLGYGLGSRQRCGGGMDRVGIQDGPDRSYTDGRDASGAAAPELTASARQPDFEFGGAGLNTMGIRAREMRGGLGVPDVHGPPEHWARGPGGASNSAAWEYHLRIGRAERFW